MSKIKIKIPRYYEPRPHQIPAWARYKSGKYAFEILNQARQTGKDTDSQERCLNFAWEDPGSQTAYVGLDNQWVNGNIFNKYIDKRRFWDDYPDDLIEVKDTQKEVYMRNNPPGKAPARIKYIGFLNDEALIGSSYDRFFISEAALYKRNAFQFVEPIWIQKKKETGKLFVSINGTPRGIKNNFYDMICEHTGETDPEAFPGEHKVPGYPEGTLCYVQQVKIYEAMKWDENHNPVRLWSDEEIEQLKDKYLRSYGNLNLYYQEYECHFGTVNAGLVYLGIEQLVAEKRYCPYNIDVKKPVYIAFDIASKDKQTDSTAAVIFQLYNGVMFIYDFYESKGVSLVQAIADISQRSYWKYVRMGFLPWDSERSASSATPIEEATELYSSVTWHALSKERVDRGIQLVREQLPNMVINSTKCDRLLECFMGYEYKRLEAEDDWSPKPIHNSFSHLMDAVRYAVMGIHEMDFFGINPDGSPRLQEVTYYDGPRTRSRNNIGRTEGGLLYYK